MLSFKCFEGITPDMNLLESPKFARYFENMVAECMLHYPLPSLTLGTCTTQPFVHVGAFPQDKMVSMISFPRFKFGVCVDIGANIGAFSCLASENFKKVHAFEPITQNHNFLNRVLKLCEISNVETYKLAVAKSSGEEIELHHDPEHTSGGATIWKSEDLESEKCKTICLESIYELVGEETIDYMKVDCEGAEYDFLLGKDLTRINIISLELHGSPEQKKPMLDFLSQDFVKVKSVENNTIVTYVNRNFAGSEGLLAAYIHGAHRCGVFYDTVKNDT